jgi:DNA-binding HxlR family transcriptional regulator
MMEKAQKNIQPGLGQLDEVTGKRTSAIQWRLKDVETISDAEEKAILPDIAGGEFIDDGEEKRTRYLNELMKALVDDGVVELTIPETPNSPKQKYRITNKGKEYL